MTIIKYPNDFGFEYKFHDNETLEKQLPSKCKNLESHRNQDSDQVQFNKQMQPNDNYYEKEIT